MRRVYIRERSAYTPSELADKLKPEDGDSVIGMQMNASPSY